MAKEVEGKLTEGELINAERRDIDDIFQDSRFVSDSSLSHTAIITFNYTSKLLMRYFKVLKDKFSSSFVKEPIFIHGRLCDPENPIIFGYGDENAEEYRELELQLNNDLLSQFKTFQYLRTSNYQQILSLLAGSRDLHVQIIGHSFGLCDKALLKIIFQHPNVKRIEPIYHQGEETYFEKLYSISRIFDDNTLMRERIIPLSETKMI